MIQKMHFQGAIILILLLASCSSDSLPVSYASAGKQELPAIKKTKIKASSRIEKYMSPLLANGFDFPVGNKNDNGPYKGRYGLDRQGWTITCGHCGKEKYGIHTGEVWDAIESNTSDLNEHVFAIAKGIVHKIEIGENKMGLGIMLRHVYLENGHFDTIYSVYKHLNPQNVGTDLKIGDTINRGQSIGSIGNFKEQIPMYLHIELRRSSIAYKSIYFKTDTLSEKYKKEHFMEVSDFITFRRKVTHPATAKKLMIAIKKTYKFYLIRDGKLVDTLEMALGQNPNYHKIRQGDNRTPEGEYKITQKAPGPFPGDIGPYFGERWIRINYPNWYDAENGFKNKIIDQKAKDRIQNAILADQKPPKDTNLGGGIGIHGWSGEWDPKGHRNITWGCISINNPDLVVLYNKIEIGDKIIISE